MSSFPPDVPLNHSPATPFSSETAAPATSVLVGPLGLRAGWGIALFTVVSILLTILLTIAFAGVSGQGKAMQREQVARAAEARRAKEMHAPAPVQKVDVPFQLMGEGGLVGGMLLAAWGMTFLERRRFGVYGLRRERVRDLLPGALCGLAALSLLIGLLHLSHALVFDQRVLNGGAALRFGAEWLLVFLLVGVGEEFMFRGYVQFTLMRGLLALGRRVSPERARTLAFWMAGLLLSLLFFAAHTMNGGETAPGLAAVFLAGLLFTYALWRTGSLWWGIGFHMTWDWAQSFLYGVPDSGAVSIGRLFATHPTGNPLVSGGMAGPEGSVLVLPIFVLVALVLRATPQREQPAVEPRSLPFVAGSVPGSDSGRILP